MGVAEPMRDRAREIVRVAGAEDAALGADGELDAPAHDDAAFLAVVAQHVRARIRAGRVALVHDRHGAVRAARRDEPERDAAIAEVGELVAPKNTCGLAERSSVKNSASDIGMPSSTFFSELTDGLTRFCSISEIRPLVTPARLASSRCDSPYKVRTARRCAPTSMPLPRVFNILHTSSAGTRSFTEV